MLILLFTVVVACILFVAFEYVEAVLLARLDFGVSATYDLLTATLLAGLMYLSMRRVWNSHGALEWTSFAFLLLLFVEWFPWRVIWHGGVEAFPDDPIRLARIAVHTTPAGIAAMLWLFISLVRNSGHSYRPFLVGVIWSMLFMFWVSTEAFDPLPEQLPLYTVLIPSVALIAVFAMMTWVFGPNRLLRRIAETKVD